MDEDRALREIISRIIALRPGDDRIIAEKIAVCRKYSLPAVPKNSALLAAALPHEHETLRKLLLVKPSRTLSGVAPIAVMTSPAPCPHGKCLPCPGGPDHPFRSPQSYTGEEPAALRAREHGYDPYRQVQVRLAQFELLGHRVDKAELIVMGGTMTARAPEYQEEFVSRCIQAMNDYGLCTEGMEGREETEGAQHSAGPKGTGSLKRTDSREVTKRLEGSGGREGGNKPADLEAIWTANETAAVRCVAITFETRPDWCRREHIGRMLSLGVTKVEIGVQHTDDRILALNRRGCAVADTIEANTLLRDAGLKVGFHMMPNMPGSDIAGDRKMFETIFADPAFRPDFLKIYPTLVTPGSEIEAMYRNGEYAPYTEGEMADLVAYAKSLIPEYTRLQRIQRDIPAKLIVAGSRHSNFRQLAQRRLRELGGRCRCIRCREIGRAPSDVEPVIQTLAYDSCGGTEHFISAVAGESLIGFCRLRFPSRPFFPYLGGAAMMRELHVYGSIVPVGKKAEDEEYQHRRFGKELLAKAEEIARNAGFSRLAIMSGIGVRPYYRRQGYEREGPYMAKELVGP